MQTKTEFIQIRLTEPDKVDLDRVAEVLDRPASQIARDAVRKEVERLKRSNAKVKAAFAELATS
jgi:predicted transcriptional regulator